MMRTLSALCVLVLFALSFAGCADDFADLSAAEESLDLTEGPDTDSGCLEVFGPGNIGHVAPRFEDVGDIAVDTPHEVNIAFYHFCAGSESDDEVLGTTVLSATEGLDVEVVQAPPVGSHVNEEAVLIVYFTPRTVGAHEARVRFSVADGHYDFTVTLEGI